MKQFEQIDLFSDFEQPIITQVNKKPSMTHNQPSSNDPFIYNDLIVSYLEKGVTSAREICNILIDKHDVDNRVFETTGKPQIYVDICKNLDYLISIDVCELIEKKNDYSDRIYKYILK